MGTIVSQLPMRSSRGEEMAFKSSKTGDYVSTLTAYFGNETKGWSYCPSSVWTHLQPLQHTAASEVWDIMAIKVIITNSLITHTDKHMHKHTRTNPYTHTHTHSHSV